MSETKEIELPPLPELKAFGAWNVAHMQIREYALAYGAECARLARLAERELWSRNCKDGSCVERGGL